MSLILDKTGHFVRLQRNRKDGLHINPHDFLLFSPATPQLYNPILNQVKSPIHAAVFFTANYQLPSRKQYLGHQPAESSIVGDQQGHPP